MEAKPKAYNSVIKIKRDMPSKEQQMLQSIYARILLYAFLTKTSVKTLSDIIKTANEGENNRIMNNLELKVELLKAINDKASMGTLCALNDKIYVNNTLLENTDSKDGKLQVVNKKFEGAEKGLMLSSSKGLRFEKKAIVNGLQD